MCLEGLFFVLCMHKIGLCRLRIPISIAPVFEVWLTIPRIKLHHLDGKGSCEPLSNTSERPQ